MPALPQIPALPRLWEFTAPQTWRAIDFISDLHLSEDMPRTFEAWAQHLRATTADAVFILGDLFDVWVGDDARHTGFGKRCAEVLSDAAAHRSVGFMVGNRDFLVGTALLQSCGVVALPDPTVLIAFGQRLLLSHGDSLCLADVEYQRFRTEVRSDAWRESFLSRPLEERVLLARQLRDGSEQRKRTGPMHDWPDIDAAAGVQWMHESGTHVLIHGHTHQPGSEPMAPGRVRHVLSDWDLDHSPPPGRAQVLRLTAAGVSRLQPAGGDVCT